MLNTLKEITSAKVYVTLPQSVGALNRENLSTKKLEELRQKTKLLCKKKTPVIDLLKVTAAYPETLIPGDKNTRARLCAISSIVIHAA